MEDSGDDYDMDLDQRTRNLGGKEGRIIMLGNGTNILTDSGDTDMFDYDDEDERSKDQSKGTVEESRSEREGTPGPPSTTDTDGEVPANPGQPETTASPKDVNDSPIQNKADSTPPPEATIKPASDTPLSPEHKTEDKKSS